MLILEVGIIDLQAARGITSHFNISTVENAVLFARDGSRHWHRAGFEYLDFGGAVAAAVSRSGVGLGAAAWLLISVLGSASGGLMTVPTAAPTRCDGAA